MIIIDSASRIESADINYNLHVSLYDSSEARRVDPMNKTRGVSLIHLAFSPGQISV